MKDRMLATRYARALLAALPDREPQERADAFLAALAKAIKDNAELRWFLFDPAVASTAKLGALKALSEAHGAPDRTASFLATIVEHGRIAILGPIAEVFHAERLRAQGVVMGTLTAAAPLPADLEARAVAALSKLSGRTVQLTVDVDPRLIGGASAQVGSTVYDGSLRTQLAHLKTRLAEE